MTKQATSVEPTAPSAQVAAERVRPLGISAVLVVRNEAEHLPRVLAAALQVADEVLVVDTGSTDATPEVAERLGVALIRLEWRGYSATKNAANTYARFSHILSLDGDEVLNQELIAALQQLRNKLAGAYTFARVGRLGQRWLRHGLWREKRKLRLFPAQGSRWVGAVHERLVLPPGVSVSRLPGELLHYAYRDLADYLDHLNCYSSLAAQNLAQRPSWQLGLRLLFNPPWRFFRAYVLKRGWRDGWLGFALARLHAWDGALRHWKALELKHQQDDPEA